MAALNDSIALPIGEVLSVGRPGTSHGPWVDIIQPSQMEVGSGCTMASYLIADFLILAGGHG